jgi:hypothetical protein
MKEAVASSLVCAALLTLAPASAMAWNSATHAYIADHIGQSSALRNEAELYGAMVPDAFNYDFSLLQNPSLYYCVQIHTHGIPGVAANFLEIWNLARTPLEKSTAFGFVCHNDVFGADDAAHHRGLTNDQELGWVIEKSRDLMALLAAERDANGLNVWDILGLDLSAPTDYPVAELICHTMVEQAGDIVLRRYSPTIGLKMALAAFARTPRIQDLMVKAMECADAAYVRQQENQFRLRMIQEGLTLLRSEADVLDAATTQLAEMAPAYLAANGIELTPEQMALVPTLSSQGLQGALALIQDDYMLEITAVISELEATMAANGVGY